MRATPPQDWLQEIKQQLVDGRISPDTLSRRLSRILEEERCKGPARMDTRLMAACEELLWQLEPAARQLSSGKLDGRRRLREGMAGQTRKSFYWPHLRLAAVALSLLLVVGGSFIYHRSQPRHQQLKSTGVSQGTPLPIQETTAVTLAPSYGPSLAPTEAPTPPPTEAPTPLPTVAETPTPEPSLSPATPSLSPATPSPIPGPKYVDITALGAPSRWTETIHSPHGELRLDVPVTVPQVGRMPVLTMAWQRLDLDALKAAAQEGQEGYAQTYQSEPELFVSMQVLPAEGQNSYLNGPTSPYGQVIYRPNEAADQNPLGPDRPLSLLREKAALAGLDPESIVVDAQAGSSGYYAQRRYTRGAQRDPQDPYADIDLSHPLQGFERGFYRLSAAQMVDGARIFPGNYLGSYMNEPGDLSPRLTLALAAPDDYELTLRAARRTGVREADLPLASFDKVKATLRERAEQGLVLALDDLELGYMLYYQQYVTQEQTAEAPLLAVPVWRARGLFLYGPTDSYPLVLHNHMVYSRTGGYTDSTVEWRINAQTGEFLDPNPMRPVKSNPAILTWEQLQDSEEDVTLLDRPD